jgi:phospholipid/cholesterol/gamma-HCH transport system ATP-binding protein
MVWRAEMINCVDIFKSYGKQKVLKGLNLNVNEGETVVILGRSGVGKSVLLKQIIGIEKPDKGYIEVDGKRISSLYGGELYSCIKHNGMLFQNAALFDSMTVGENTAFYLRQNGDADDDGDLSNEEILHRVQDALKTVGLEGTEDKMPSDLSGGMKKRAALARLIIYKPKILLYDEPTAGLDPITSMQINDLINKVQNDLKATSIVVTHDLRSALEVGDRLALHHDGVIAHIANKKEFIHINDPLVKTFFENVSMESLLREIENGGIA